MNGIYAVIYNPNIQNPIVIKKTKNSGNVFN